MLFASVLLLFTGAGKLSVDEYLKNKIKFSKMQNIRRTFEGVCFVRDCKFL